MKKTKSLSRSSASEQSSQVPTHPQISAKAEEIWINRGRPEGRDQEIWFEAEKHLSIGAAISSMEKADDDLENLFPGQNGPSITAL
jgi:Protein of unknown function (DUF2934)